MTPAEVAAALEQLRRPEPAVEHIRNVETVLRAELQLTAFAPPDREVLERIAVRARVVRVKLEEGRPVRVAGLVGSIRRELRARRLDVAALELLADVLPRLEKAVLTA